MKTLWSLLFVPLFFSASAQKFTASVSDPFKYDGDKATPVKAGDAYYALEADAKMQFGFTFKLNKAKFAIKLARYDKAMQLTKEVSLSAGEKVYGPLKPMLKSINDKPYLLYFMLSGEDERIRLYAAEINPSDLSLSAPDEVLVIEQKNVGLQQAGQLMSNYTFEFSTSPDRSKLLALWSSGINNRFFFSVFDGGFKKIRSVAETIEGEREIAVKNACVNNDGAVFAAYEADEKARIYASGVGGKRTDQEVTLLGGTAYEVFVLPSVNGADIQVAGTYKGEKDNLVGVFTQTFNSATLRLGTAQQTIFPKTLVEQFDNDGWGSSKEKKYGLTPMRMRPYLLPDGTVDLVGEFRSSQSGTRTTFIISGDLVNVGFKKGGPVFSRIPKARVSAGSTIGDSFGAVPTAAGLAIFYNDNVSNLKKDIAASPNRSDNYNNNVLVVATLNDDGSVKREVLIDLSRESYLPIAESLQRPTASTVLVPVRRIKGFGGIADDFRWGTVSIN